MSRKAGYQIKDICRGIFRKTGKCEETPKYREELMGTNAGVRLEKETCLRHREETESHREEKDGNKVVYNVQGSYFWLHDVNTTFCRRKEGVVSQCSCKALLKIALDRYPLVDTIHGDFVAKPWKLGCRCYLGVAARAGFNYVELNSYEPRCNGERMISVENYVEVCKEYKKYDCQKERNMDGRGQIRKNSRPFSRAKKFVERWKNP